MFCNVAFVGRMLVLVALAAEIAQIPCAVNAAPAARGSGWDVVTEAAEASMVLPVQSVSRIESDFGTGGASTASTGIPSVQVQNDAAAALASMHDVQDQVATTAAPQEAAVASTYELCRSLYPELVPTKVVAPSNVTSVSAYGGVSSSPTKPNNPGGNTNNTGGSSSQDPSKSSNTTQLLPCNTNTQDYVDMCVYCEAYGKTEICTKFRPGPGQCDSVKKACLGKYTPKTPRYITVKRRQSANNAAAQQHTGSFTTNAADNNNSSINAGVSAQVTGSPTPPAAAPLGANNNNMNVNTNVNTNNAAMAASNTGGQPEQQVVNEMLCQQVLNAPRN